MPLFMREPHPKAAGSVQRETRSGQNGKAVRMQFVRDPGGLYHTAGVCVCVCVVGGLREFSLSWCILGHHIRKHNWVYRDKSHKHCLSHTDTHTVYHHESWAVATCQLGKKYLLFHLPLHNKPHLSRGFHCFICSDYGWWKTVFYETRWNKNPIEPRPTDFQWGEQNWIFHSYSVTNTHCYSDSSQLILQYYRLFFFFRNHLVSKALQSCLQSDRSIK